MFLKGKLGEQDSTIIPGFVAMAAQLYDCTYWLYAFLSKHENLFMTPDFPLTFGLEKFQDEIQISIFLAQSIP